MRDIAQEKFDPDKYLQEKAKSPSIAQPFDPDKYLEEKSGKGVQSPSDFMKFYTEDDPGSYADKLQARTESAGNALTLGYLPHIEAGVQSAFGDDDYLTARDKNIKRLQEQEKAFPKTTLQGKGVGMLAGALATPELPILKGAGLIKSGLRGSIYGAGFGAAQNPGDTEGKIDPIQADARLDNAESGAVLGAKLGAGTDLTLKIADVLKRSPELFKKIANSQALKAAGIDLKTARSLFGRNKVGEVGQFALDNGLVKAGDSVENVAEKASDLRNKSGDTLDDIYSSSSGDFNKNKAVNDSKATQLQQERDNLQNMIDNQKNIDNPKYSSPISENKVEQIEPSRPSTPEPNNFSSDGNEFAFKKSPFAKKTLPDKNISYENGGNEMVGLNLSDIEKPYLPENEYEETSTNLHHLLGEMPDNTMTDLPKGISEGERNDFLKDQSISLPKGLSADKYKGLLNERSGAIDKELSSMNDSYYSKSGFNPTRDKNSILKSVKQELGDSADKKSAVRAASDYLDQLIEDHGDNILNPRTANNIKTELDAKIDYTRNPLSKDPAAEKGYSAMRDFVSQAVENHIDEIGKSSGNPDLAQKLSDANKQYGNAKSIERMSKDRVNRNLANKNLGLTDKIVGTGGLVAGGIAGAAMGGMHGSLEGAALGLLAGAGSHAASKYGPGLLASGANYASKIAPQTLQPIGKILSELPPDVLQKLIIQSEQSDKIKENSKDSRKNIYQTISKEQ